MSGESGQDRRGFLRAAGRWSLALLLSGGVGALSLGRRDRCANAGLCGGCRALQTCELPDAVTFRQTERDVQGWTDARADREDDAP